MKKWVWAAPAAVFLLALSMVLYLRARDVSPALLIGAGEAPSWAPLSQTEVVSLLEKNLAAFEAAATGEGPLPAGVSEKMESGALVLARKFGGFVQALIPPSKPKEAAEAFWRAASAPPFGPAENYAVSQTQIPLGGGWLYGIVSVKPLAQSHRYAKLAAARMPSELAAIALPEAEWVCLLQQTQGQPLPAGRSKSQYVIAVLIPMSDGTALAGYIDPKNLVFLGFAES